MGPERKFASRGDMQFMILRGYRFADRIYRAALEIHNNWTHPRDEDDRVDESHSDFRLEHLNDLPEQTNARSRC